MTTDYLLLMRSLGSADPKHYVDWAVDSLGKGIDTPNLRILAGLNPRLEHDEIEPYFQKTCKELNIDIVDQDNTPRQSALLVKNVYDHREISAEEALEIMASLWEKSDYSDPLLRIFSYIEEELSLQGSGYEGSLYPHEKLASLDYVFDTEWLLFERALRLDIPSDYDRFIQCIHCGYIGEPKKHQPLAIKIKTKISEFKPKPPWSFTCARCGSHEFRGMASPEVRDAYFTQLESK